MLTSRTAEQSRDSVPLYDTVKCVGAREGSTVTKLSEPLDKENWMGWHERMKQVLRLCQVEAYAEGKIKFPMMKEESRTGGSIIIMHKL